jgi:hypothetical protein
VRNLKGRLDRLEKATTGDGRCPGCGFAADDIRTISVREQVVDSEEQVPPDVEELPANAPVPDQPDRPRCAVCGGYMPPIAIVGALDEDTLAPFEREPGAFAPAWPVWND